MRASEFGTRLAELGVVVGCGVLLACGGGQTQQVRQDRAPASAFATETGKPEAEDLTERKVVKPAEPEWVEGVDREAQNSFRRGVLAVYRSPPDYASAAVAFEDAISRDKGFLEAYLNLGMTYERMGKPQEAIKAYERASSAVPGNPHSVASIGKVYLSLAKKAKAEGDAARAAQLESEAKRTFDGVIAKDPDNVTANNALALYWLYHGDAKTAEDFVKKVLMVQPKNVVALNTRGLINLMAGKLNIARWVFEEKALREDPNSTEAWTNLGLTYLKMGKTPEAVASFEKAMAAEPDNVEAALNVAAIYLEYLHYQAALDMYERVLKRDPNNVEALTGAGSCKLGLHEPKEAVAYWERALKSDPSRGILYGRIGKIWELTLNDMDKAIEAYEAYVRIVKPGPGDPVAAKLPVLKQLKAQGGMKAPEEPPKTPEGGGEPGMTPPPATSPIPGAPAPAANPGGA